MNAPRILGHRYVVTAIDGDIVTMKPDGDDTAPSIAIKADAKRGKLIIGSVCYANWTWDHLERDWPSRMIAEIAECLSAAGFRDVEFFGLCPMISADAEMLGSQGNCWAESAATTFSFRSPRADRHR